MSQCWHIGFIILFKHTSHISDYTFYYRSAFFKTIDVHLLYIAVLCCMCTSSNCHKGTINLLYGTREHAWV